MALNINRSVVDAFYRYKMPPVEVKLEKNKTVIVNAREICESIARDESHLRRFLGHKLAVGTSEKKDKMSTKTLLNGFKSQLEVQNAVFDFIDEFVLCGSCGNPETIFQKGSSLSLKCLACGQKTKLRASQMANAIQNSLKERKEKRKKRVREPKTVEEIAKPGGKNSSESDEDWSEDTSAEAVAARRATEISATALSLIRR